MWAGPCGALVHRRAESCGRVRGNARNEQPEKGEAQNREREGTQQQPAPDQTQTNPISQTSETKPNPLSRIDGRIPRERGGAGAGCRRRRGDAEDPVSFSYCPIWFFYVRVLGYSRRAARVERGSIGREVRRARRPRRWGRGERGGSGGGGSRGAASAAGTCSAEAGVARGGARWLGIGGGPAPRSGGVSGGRG